MKTRTMLLVFGALFAVACASPKTPEPITNFLSGGNRTIADVIREAAADWARHGLEIANYVTVDDEGKGLPVRFATDEELVQAGVADTTIGVTRRRPNGEWIDMLLYDQLDPEKLLYIVKHELIHALVPGSPHLEGIGVYSSPRTTHDITRADMAHLARYTEVGPSEVPFAGEAA